MCHKTCHIVSFTSAHIAFILLYEISFLLFLVLILIFSVFTVTVCYYSFPLFSSAVSCSVTSTLSLVSRCHFIFFIVTYLVIRDLFALSFKAQN